MLTFPTSPTLDQIYTVDDKSWTWNGSGWIYNSSAVAVATLGYTPAHENGVSTTDFTAANFVIHGNIMPSTTGFSNIGSPGSKFNAIYTKEMHIDANTLYVDGTPVLASSANAIQITADLNQGLRLSTTGTGTILLDSSAATTIKTNGVNADVLIQTDGLGSTVRLTSATQITITSPLTAMIGNSSVSGSMTVSGDLTIAGTTTTVNTTNLAVKDNVITLNKGEAGSGVTWRYAGIDIDRGDLARQRLVWDETAALWKAGETGVEVALATQPYVTSALAAVGAGASGPVGYTGSAGTNGTAGASGPVGYTGSAGDVGASGAIGYTGSIGASGVLGYTGSAGAGLPAGGAVSQVLQKASATDYDYTWQSKTTFPSQAYIESITVLTAPGAVITIDTLSQSGVYYTSATTANITINFRGSATATLNNTLAIGQSTTVIVLITNTATAYIMNTFQIDGVGATLRWLGGTAPTAGSANSIDCYNFTIIKTAASTYTVLAGTSKFA